MEGLISLQKMLMSICVVGLLASFMRLLSALVLEPKRVRSMLKKQGIDGPPPTILLGNIIQIKRSLSEAAAKSRSNSGNTSAPSFHNCSASIFPFFERWRNQYGSVFTFSIGNRQIIYVNRPDLVKEITTCTSMDLGKPAYQQKELGPLLGQGILTSNGSIWAHQRKILAPELFMDKVKGMMDIVKESTVTLIKTWTREVEAKGGVAEIRVDDYLKRFSGDIISRACFGSSYAKGQEIFVKLGALQEAMSKKTLSGGIPGLRSLPTKSNREIWALEKEVNSLILKVVKERTETAGYEKDLLQMLLEGVKTSGGGGELSQGEIDQFIVDNCKNIYLAGYETSAVAASWCLMLLSTNQEWQTRVRDEALQVCPQGQIPDADMLRKMKQLAMVLQETLRLYPPGPALSREALKDLKIGDLSVPKGVNVWTMVATLHTDPEIWGPDAYKFNPDRFANGITSASKFPNAYVPFGFGQRVCLGQHLAMAELKLLISQILSNFSISISPEYVHSPTMTMIIEPGHGVTLTLKKL